MLQPADRPHDDGSCHNTPVVSLALRNNGRPAAALLRQRENGLPLSPREQCRR